MNKITAIDPETARRTPNTLTIKGPGSVEKMPSEVLTAIHLPLGKRFAHGIAAGGTVVGVGVAADFGALPVDFIGAHLTPFMPPSRLLEIGNISPELSFTHL